MCGHFREGLGKGDGDELAKSTVARGRGEATWTGLLP